MNGPVSHDRFLELLPWLVNGTLSRSEREVVEQHVRQCLPCRAALREQQRLAALVKSQPTVRLSTEQGFDQLMSRLDEAERATGVGAPPRNQDSARTEPLQQHAPRGALRSLRRSVQYFGQRSALGRAAIAAGTLVVVVGLTSWLTLTSSYDPVAADYVTLTSSADGPAGRIDIVFSNDVTEAEMRSLVREIRGTIVGGPSDIGRYTVLLDGPSSTDAEVAMLIDRLRNDRRVRFAGRVLTENRAPSRID